MAASPSPFPVSLDLTTARAAVITLHRPSAVSSPEVLDAVLDGLSAVADQMPVVFPLHPRTQKKNIQAFGMSARLERFQIMEPLSYLEMLSLVDGSVVLTDSGGLMGRNGRAPEFMRDAA
jgi:UDP-N-acetylglucosamine 2-epimerase (non-hydrolysing)